MRACRSGGGVIIGGCGGLGVWCWCGWWRWWSLNSGKLAREWWWVRLLCRGGGWEMRWCSGGSSKLLCRAGGVAASVDTNCEARLPIPAGILQIPVFSVPVALFSHKSRFLFRRNFFLTPSEIRSVWGQCRMLRGERIC
jgi:hypothetical protein